MAFVLKIKYGNVLRRVNIPLQNWPGNHPNMSFTELQRKVRDLFQIPPTVPLVLTYTDCENDVVTLGDQQDLIDACVVQGLNPLYLTVTTPITTTSRTNQSNTATSAPLAPGPTSQPTQSSIATSTPGTAMGSGIESVGSAIESVLRGVLTTSGAIDKMNGHLGLMLQPLLKSSSSSKLLSDALEGIMKVALKQPQAGSGNSQPPSAMAWSRSSSSTTSSYSVQSGDNRQPRAQHPQESGMFHPPGSSLSRSSSDGGPQMARKLDACFVKDVTILDGTKLAPGTQFAKIWCLRNEGTLPWPHKTQLVHVGGPLLGSNKAVNLELPKEGLGANKEIEAFIDFMAPMEPGRYASHWRLMSPLGQKFGHRVWVDIQVVPRVELEEVVAVQSGDNNSEGGYLMVDKETEHNTETEFLLNNNTLATTEMQQDICESENGEGYDIIEKPLLETPSRSSSFSSSQDSDGDLSSVKVASTTLEETLQEPILGEEEGMATTTTTITTTTTEASDVVEVTVVEPSINENLSSDKEILGIVQEACLEQLEYMGFNMKTLNLELLHKNKNNLQQTIQDLSTIVQWDPTIKVLEDMGFKDKELNYCLMFKNDGSVKRVVKDLVLMQVSEGKNVKGKEKAQ